MEDPHEDFRVVHCFCISGGSALLGGLLGVSRFMEHEVLSVLRSVRKVGGGHGGLAANDVCQVVFTFTFTFIFTFDREP